MQDDRTPDSPSAETPPPTSTATLLSTRQKVLAWLERFKKPVASVAALGAIASGFAGYWTAYRVVNTSMGAGADSSSKKPVASAGPLSIVVLPFTNVTGDASQDYVADGFTESITSDLSRIPSAFVVGASTAQAYKGKTTTAKQVGAELGVRFVLRGTIQRSATKLRVNAQLVDATDNAQLWTQTFDGETTDLLALQDQVTTLIGNSMGEVLVVKAASVSERREGDATVGDLLLRARALALRPQSSANWMDVQALLRKALAIEPANLDAMNLLAASVMSETLNFGFERPVEERNKAADDAVLLSDKVAASRPNDARMLLTRFNIAYARRDLPAMQRTAQRMVEVSPRNEAAYVNEGLYYYYALQPEQALVSYRKSLAVFPGQSQDSLLFNFCKTEFMLRHYEEAVGWCIKFRDSNPARAALFPDLAVAYAKAGHASAARATVATVLKAQPAYSVSSWLEKIKAIQPDEPSYQPYSAWYAREIGGAMRLAGFPE